MDSKLPGGGGGYTCHSRPRDCHGLASARSRTITVDQTKLITKIRMDPPSRKAEIETQSLRVCRFRAYSKTRRGWPARPTANSGRKVELKKMNIVQNPILPSFWFRVMPVIL